MIKLGRFCCEFNIAKSGTWAIDERVHLLSWHYINGEYLFLMSFILGPLSFMWGFEK